MGSDRGECGTVPQMDVEVVGTAKGERVDFGCRGVMVRSIIGCTRTRLRGGVSRDIPDLR